MGEYFTEKKIGDEFKMVKVQCNKCLNTELIKKDGKYICNRCGKEVTKDETII